MRTLLALGAALSLATAALPSPGWTRRRLAEVDDFRIDEISKAAGRSTHEVRTWVAAFAALAATGPYAARKDYYRAINEWIAGYGVVSAEPA